MRILIYIVFGVFLSFSMNAQQIAHTSPFQEMQHIWNPAFTAPGKFLDASVYYRRQWLGFEGAPNTAVASVQYPFEDMNMSAGGMIISDRTGQVAKTGLQVNYAYKLKDLINRGDQLSLGVNGFFHQYTFDATSAVTFEENDPFVTSRQSKFLPSFGAGIAYFSSTKEYDGDNIFFAGFSALQLLATDVLIESGNAFRKRHFFVNVGTKLFGASHYIQPSLQVNFVNPQLIDYVLAAKFEMEESFWAGLSFSSVNNFGINGGVIIDEIGGRYTQLKLGVMASMGEISNAGPSFEFFAAYTLKLK